MKSLFIIALLVAVVSCKKEQPPKDYAVIHGKITNPKEAVNLRLYDALNNKNVMVAVNADGSFRDTLKLEAPVTFTGVYENTFGLYLANNMDIQITLDTENFANSIAFKGKGEAENNFLKFMAKESKNLYGEDYKDYLSLEQSAFDAKTNNFLANANTELEAKKALLDTAFVRNQQESLKTFQEQNIAAYTEQQKINKVMAKGNPSPEFNNYTNYSGGTSSLKDYRGSYVYIDVWATWCAPCIYEIPFLDKVEKQYHDKNIKFISLSIDNLKDEQKWRDMIKNDNLGGIQLLADNDYGSQFVQDYFIYGIPRFILIDPNGNIVNYDAPRPSEERLITLLASLNL